MLSRRLAVFGMRSWRRTATRPFTGFGTVFFEREVGNGTWRAGLSHEGETRIHGNPIA